MSDLDAWLVANPHAPDGLLQAFDGYERALMTDDLAALDALFDQSPDTLRGDPGGLLVGHAAIHDFRAARRGAPARTLVAVRVQRLADEAACVVAVTAPARGGHGLQTQVWRRQADGAWRITAAQVAPPPVTFDPAVWRAVGDPLCGATGLDESAALRGESVAVKDLFAVAGFAIGAGVPQWLAGAPLEAADADAVARLRAAGATVTGIARTDQFAYSLAGDNPHYGTPVNARVPGGLPGGSSSGSATAVALGAASIGLATDTGGSVRVPASYQGLWGWRSTHGAVSAKGLLPLAPDFDTVGLLTSTPDLMARAAATLLESPAVTAPGDHVIVDLLPEVEPAAAAAFDGWVARALPRARRVRLPDLAQAAEAFRVHQAYQAWQQHGDWVARHPNALLGAARERFTIAARVSPAQDAMAVAALDRLRAEFDRVLGDATLVLPSAAGPAPKVWAAPSQVEQHRRATMALTCIAGITGRPAVSAPLLTLPDGPLGICLVGPRSSDPALIERATGLPTGA